jgi:sigma-B regulation protein RsbU (phosphoserine phosphatase)
MPGGRLQSSYLRLFLLAFMLSTIVLEFPGARDFIAPPYSGIETRNLVVQNVRSHGPNSSLGIAQGDEITRVDGVLVHNYNHLRYLVSRNRSFAPQEYAFAHDGATYNATVRYIAVPESIIYRHFGSALVGFTFLFVGLLVLLRRDDVVGILFSSNCAIFAFFLTDRPIFPTAFLQLAGELFHDMVILLFPAVFLHFFLVFHDRPRGVNRPVRIRRAWLYTVPVALFATSSVLTVRRFFFLATSPNVVGWILGLSTLYYAVYLTLSLVVFMRNYRASSPAQKQKLRIAIVGTSVGIIPFLSMLVWRQFIPGSYTTWEFVSVLGLAVISVSFAYAILKHGAIQLNIVLKKSLVYAFVTGLVIAAYYGVVNVVGSILVEEFELNRVYFSVITILVLAVVFAPLRDIVQRLVDRIFFRGDYDSNHEVVELNRNLSRKLTRGKILAYVFDRMQTLLKASFVAFYTTKGESERWTIESVAGEARELPEIFPKHSLLGRYLSRYKKPLMVEYLDHAWGRRNLDETSTAFLESSRAAVCLPLGVQESFIGLLVLGPKRSGLPYNQTDADFLERCAEHLALVLENAELHEAAIEQERLKNEVLLAREIQLSLLPRESPHHPLVAVLGKMASSVEVGGDYFDYFLLEPHRVGVAVGDVNGKGVPAAMLMASVQAVFKNLAARDRMNPADLVTALNRYLCENAKADLFATFFYGIIDPLESTFIYTNAGHCPALLLRTEFVDRLGEGGLPLGVDATHVYREGRVRIDRGDMVGFYTDGVTEQTDAAGEEFGEQRLIQLLRANRNLPLPGLLDSLFASVLAFGGGNQDDDVTAVILRYEAT